MCPAQAAPVGEAVAVCMGGKMCLGVNFRASGDGFGGLFAKHKRHVYRYRENTCFT